MKLEKTICLEREASLDHLQQSLFCAANTTIGKITSPKPWCGITREALEEALRHERDSDTMRRMLLVLKVKFEGIGQNQAARELNCASSWATKWVRRFEEQGVKGLKTKERSARLLKNDPRERTCTVARSEDRMRSTSSTPSLHSDAVTVPEASPNTYGRQLNYSKTFARLESADNIRSENKELIKKFLDATEVNGNIKTNRLIKYCDKLTTVAKCIAAQSTPFDSMTANDVNAIIVELKRKAKTRGVGKGEKLNYSASTINDFKIILKIFWRWMKDWRESGYPPEVKDLKVAKAPKIMVTRSDLLTEEELAILIRASNSVMYSALIWTLYDTGGRIGEVLALRVGDVQPQVYGARLNFHASKTMPRPMPVVKSAPAIAAWLAIHPFNKYPKAPLWINTKMQQLMYGTARKKLLNTCRDMEKIAGRKLWKRVHFHLFRHMAATDFMRESKGSQGIMNKRFGWTAFSDMAARYSHLLEEDVEMSIVRADAPTDLYEKFVEEVRATKSINPKQVTKPLLQICNRCQSTNDMFAHYCNRCGFPLSDQATKAVLLNEIERGDESNSDPKVSSCNGCGQKNSCGEYS